MTTSNLTRGGASSPDVILQFPEHRSVAYYERELKRMEERLQQALGRADSAVRQGDALIGLRAILNRLVTWRGHAMQRIGTLTLRQRQIMEPVLAGCPSKIIAEGIGISQHTVESHRAEIFKRTGAKCLASLARLAVVASWNSADELLA